MITERTPATMHPRSVRVSGRLAGRATHVALWAAGFEEFFEMLAGLCDRFADRLTPMQSKPTCAPPARALSLSSAREPRLAWLRIRGPRSSADAGTPATMLSAADVNYFRDFTPRVPRLAARSLAMARRPVIDRRKMRPGGEVRVGSTWSPAENKSPRSAPCAALNIGNALAAHLHWARRRLFTCGRPSHPPPFLLPAMRSACRSLGHKLAGGLLENLSLKCHASALPHPRCARSSRPAANRRSSVTSAVHPRRDIGNDAGAGIPQPFATRILLRAPRD